MKNIKQFKEIIQEFVKLPVCDSVSSTSPMLLSLIQPFTIYCTFIPKNALLQRVTASTFRETSLKAISSDI